MDLLGPLRIAAQERGKGPYALWQGVLIEDDVGDGAPLLALAEENTAFLAALAECLA